MTLSLFSYVMEETLIILLTEDCYSNSTATHHHQSYHHHLYMPLLSMAKLLKRYLFPLTGWRGIPLLPKYYYTEYQSLYLQSRWSSTKVIRVSNDNTAPHRHDRCSVYYYCYHSLITS